MSGSKNARNIALIGVILIGVAALGWKLLSDSGTGASGLEASGSGREQAATPELPSAELETPLARVDEDGARTEATGAEDATEEAETSEPEPRTWPEAESVWLDVRVVLPEGTPGEERVEVLALSRAGTYDDLYGGRGLVTRRREGKDPRAIEGSLAGADCGTDQVARIGLPPGTTECWLAVNGSFVYSSETLPVTLDGANDAVQLHPLLGARISGRLQLPPDADPEHLAETELELSWSTNAALQLGTAGSLPLDLEARPDERGQYEFRGVPCGKPQSIVTGGSPLARTFLADVQPAPGEHLVVDIDLLLGGTLRGRVVDEQGAPVPEVRVRALGREFLGNPTDRLRQTESEEDGSFLLTGVTPGKVWLQAEHDGFQDLLDAPLMLEDREVHERGDLVLSKGLAIRGVLRFPDGGPAAEATVTVQPDLSENLAGTIVDPHAYLGAGNDCETDEDGAFEIVGLGPGPWLVTADSEVDGDGTERVPGDWSAEAGRVRAPAEALELTLEPPVVLLGTVVDGTGQPVPAFRIHGERAGSQWYMPPSATRDESFESEEGRFELEKLRSGSWTFSASGTGFAKSEELTLEMPTTEEPTFTLLRPIRIAGTVVDPEGKPVAGAEVSEELEGTEVFEAMQGRGDWPVAQSDGTGTFSLEGLAPGAGAVVAKKDGFAPSEPAAFELAEGEESLDLVLTLRRGGSISGLVYGEEGEPSPGCLVILQMPTLAERRFTNASGEGTFVEHGLTPGTWQVQAFPGIESLQTESGEAMDQATLIAALEMGVVELADEAEEYIVLGAPPENPVRVQGRVTLDDEPLVGSVISFVPGGGGGMESLKIDTLDGDGRYSMQLDEPGAYLVTVQSGGSPGLQNSIEFRCNVPEGETHEQDFEMPLARVSGRVEGPDGEPLARARVTLTVQGGLVFGTVFGGQYSESVTDADGEYEITGLRPGNYAVAAGGAPFGGVFGEGTALGRAVQTIEIEEGESIRGLNFRLEQPGRVVGTVRDTAGKPVSGASIFLRDTDGNLVELFSLAQTNASGSFEYPGLAPGEYTVVARSATHATAAGVPVRVRSGEASRVEVVVQPGTMLLVTLVDKTGADLRSRVSVLDADGRDMNGMLGLTEIMERYSGGLDNTVQRIGPLPPGSYRVGAVAEDGRTTVRPVQLSGQPERKLKLRLK